MVWRYLWWLAKMFAKSLLTAKSMASQVEVCLFLAKKNQIDGYAILVAYIISKYNLCNYSSFVLLYKPELNVLIYLPT